MKTIKTLALRLRDSFFVTIMAVSFVACEGAKNGADNLDPTTVFHSGSGSSGSGSLSGEGGESESLYAVDSNGNCLGVMVQNGAFFNEFDCDDLNNILNTYNAAQIKYFKGSGAALHNNLLYVPSDAVSSMSEVNMVCKDYEFTNNDGSFVVDYAGQGQRVEIFFNDSMMAQGVVLRDGQDATEFSDIAYQETEPNKYEAPNELDFQFYPANLSFPVNILTMPLHNINNRFVSCYHVFN